MKIFRLSFLMMIAYASILMGCGQKGPLYLPEKQTPPKIEVESTTPKKEGASQETANPTNQTLTPAASDEVNQ